MNTEKLFVPYELALALKEKGFDEHCFSAYRNEDGEKMLLPLGKWNNSDACGYNKEYCAAPIYQQACDWLREKHNLIIEIQLDQTTYIKFMPVVIKWNGIGDFDQKTAWDGVGGWLYTDYYDALKKAITEALKLI